MYIYNSILTSVYNYRSVHLRNINGHEQWGRGAGAYKVFCPFVRCKNDTRTRRILRNASLGVLIFIFSSPRCFQNLFSSQDTRAQQDSIPGINERTEIGLSKCSK